MNCAVYIFGNLSSGYAQYPNDDATASIFKGVYANARAMTQIAVHRQGPLMYYCYLRKLQGEQYIGISAVINNLMMTDMTGLFALFENAIAKLAEAGFLIKYDDFGNLVGNVKQLYQDQEEIQFVTDTLRRGFEHLVPSARELPAVNYGVASDSAKAFSCDDDIDDILRSSSTNAYTFIYKDRNFDTSEMSDYRSTLSRVSQQRNAYAQQLRSAKTEIVKLKAQKRNIGMVSLLGVIAVVFGVLLCVYVIFPSEVTKYDAGEFTYYGPLVNKVPHGVGIAIYPKGDEFGRKYYIGNFNTGQREDTAAMLIYRNGDYFYGTMHRDKLVEGMLYKKTDGTYYQGTFDSTQSTLDGAWYDHVFKHKVVKGHAQY